MSKILFGGLLILVAALVFGIGTFLALGNMSNGASKPPDIPDLDDLGTQVQDTVQDTVQDGEEKGLSYFQKVVLPEVLSSITENPILSPVIKTQKEVSEAVNTVKSLPGDQRDALCSQICPR